MSKTIDRPVVGALANGRMLSAKEAMAYLGVGKTTLYEMTFKWKPGDRLPSYKYGKHRKYRLVELDWWLEKHREPI